VSSWGRLDAHAPWKEYAAGCSAPDVVEAVQRFKPDVVLGVDWTSLPAYEALMVRQRCAPPAVFAVPLRL
jgi:hypothetical protein